MRWRRALDARGVGGVLFAISASISVFTIIVVVAIEVSPPAPTSALEAALVRACSDAVRPGVCEIARPGARPSARVTWVSETIVDVTANAEEGTSPSFRRVVFRPGDPELDRWQATGLVVASLANADTDRSGAKRRASPMTLPPRSPNAVWVSAYGLLGNGLSAGPARYGASLRAGYQVAHLPAFVSLGTGYARAAEDARGVTPEWAAFSLGGGASLELPSLHVALRPALELELERIAARASGAPNAASSGRWLAATEVVFTLTWPARAPVALVLGGLGSFATGATGVRENGTQIASFPALGYAGLLGIELGFGN